MENNLFILGMTILIAGFLGMVISIIVFIRKEHLHNKRYKYYSCLVLREENNICDILKTLSKYQMYNNLRFDSQEEVFEILTPTQYSKNGRVKKTKWFLLPNELQEKTKKALKDEDSELTIVFGHTPALEKLS